MQGSLSQINIAELLCELYLSKRTGILRLSQGELKKGVYFKEGSIVFAHSNLKSDRLGETLLRLGKITEEEFEDASVDVIQKGKRLGRVLWEKGYLSQADVTAGVNYQLQQIVYSVFNWDSGEYEFVERERPVYEDIMVDISTPDLLISGIRHITNPVALQRAVGDDETKIVQRNEGVRKIPRVDLDFGEETILACLDERTTIGRLRNLCQLSEMEFGRAIYSLLLSGMIRVRVGGPEDKIVPEAESRKRPLFTTRPMESGGEPLSEYPPSMPRMKTYSEPEMRKMIVETEGRFRDITDEEVLGVLPDCTREELDAAFRNLQQIFQPPYYSEERYHDLKDKLKFVCDRLVQAHERLQEKISARLPLSEMHLESQGPSGKMPEIIRQPHLEVIPPAVPVSDAKPRPPVSAPQRVKVEEPPREPTLAELEERTKKEPANVSLLRRLGRKLQESGKPIEAEKHLLRALELEPQNVENHFALAELYQAQGLKLKAFKHLKIILQLQPENERALEMLSLKKSKKPLYEITPNQES